MPKARKLLLTISGGVLLVGIWIVAHKLNEGPYYGGHSLRKWLDLYNRCGTAEVPWERREEITTAVRNIGTNAVPYLLKWIQYEPQKWQSNLGRKLYKSEVLYESSLLQSLTYDGEKLNRSLDAIDGFRILGPQAASAIPQLNLLLNDINHPDVQINAAQSLSAIGKDAFPLLIAQVTNTANPNQLLALGALCGMDDHGEYARPLVPILIQYTKGTNDRVAAMAIQTLAQFNVDSEVILPAITNAFASSNSEARFWAVRSFIIWRTEEAEYAAPALRGLQSDSNYLIREYASNILASLPTHSSNTPPLK